MRVLNPATGLLERATSIGGAINFACGCRRRVRGVVDRSTLPRYGEPIFCYDHRADTTITSVALSGPAELLWPDPEERAEVEYEIWLDKTSDW